VGRERGREQGGGIEGRGGGTDRLRLSTERDRVRG
jgi:hypothetical protein